MWELPVFNVASIVVRDTVYRDNDDDDDPLDDVAGFRQRIGWPVQPLPSCAKGRGVAHITGAIGRVCGIDNGSDV